MPNLTSVGLTAGLGTSGTGSVSTLDNIIGTAGTASAQVLTVQGVASGTKLFVQPTDGTNNAAVKAASTAPVAADPSLVVAISPNSVNANGQATMANSAPVVIASNQSPILTTDSLAIGSTTSGQTGGLQMGAVTTAAPSYTTAQTDPLSLTTAGGLRVDLASVAGTATPVGSGVQATAPRVTLATDSPGIVALGQTTKSASVPVVLASDQVGTAGTANANVVTVQGIASMTKLLVTPDSVALPANQSVNTAQVNGITTLTGTGATGTGSQRVTVAVDTATVAGTAPGRNTAANSVPIITGPALLGSYAMGANTGTMAAGLAAGSPVFSFRYGAANLAIVRKIVVEADNITTAFVAGAAKFDLIAARSFSASDTGGTAGTLTTNNGKLRTSFASTGVSDFRISSTATLTAGTRTLDAQPLATVEFAVPTSIDADLLPTTVLFQAQTITDQPLVLAQNEGFVIQATVPGTGTWVFSVRVVWDEVSSF